MLFKRENFMLPVKQIAKQLLQAIISDRRRKYRVAPARSLKLCKLLEIERAKYIHMNAKKLVFQLVQVN